jgi:hypothetical protein
MRYVLHAMLLAFMAFLPGVANAEVKQIRLTEKQIQAFISAQKEMAAIAEKMPSDDKPDPQIQTQLEAAAKKHGFANFAEYDDVAANISMIMAGIDTETKKFTDPRVALQKELAEVTADSTIPPAEKKKMIDELNEQLKISESIKYPSNIDLVLKYYDKLDAELQ